MAIKPSTLQWALHNNDIQWVQKVLSTYEFHFPTLGYISVIIGSLDCSDVCRIFKMMKILIILTIAAMTSADKRCHGIDVANRYYNLNIIKDGINNIHDLVLNRNDNTVYFTFDDISKTPRRTRRLLGHLNTDTGVATVIDGIRNATAIAIDHINGKIYVGGSDGLYKINEMKGVEKLPIHDDIKSMHFKDNLYFVNHRREAYKFEDGFSALVPELRGVEVDSLVFDDDNNIFFTQNTKLFRIKLNTRAINTHESYLANAISTDSYSKVYICTSNGLFVYNKYKYVFDKVANLNNLKAITFNRKNEPVYAAADYIVKLSLSEIGCFED
ncbi:uncharacterized protein LOC124540727 [Vanessa cardui]|uniref:uncharacterized protein LOC124540727 n=1 Tax=Vanessa cardui TaxID=171605 RepID=UPI001F149171|nr:uncharacterized protein LOC124540727 [Vanessa cardui]